MTRTPNPDALIRVRPRRLISNAEYLNGVAP